MKYVIMIHSNPQPWGHPTSDYLAAHRELPDDVRKRLQAEFEQVMTDLQANGELIGGEALGDPAAARLYRWRDGAPLASDGPYSETREHLAGFFLIDVESQARAEEVAARFAGPDETVELRPMMWPGGEDQ
ncbi:YciI family protein [Plantactinospora sp. GCM10030261]|uniref:YciI family protein n=1 Tax=Plantactinospora sp. GCM10030261 TaxID=3273420 RepID=UPI0036243819